MSAEVKQFDAEQNTQAWLAERRKYMGSSDAPAAMGMSRYRSPVDVAVDKRQARTANHHPEPETPEQRRGHVLEPVVARLYEDETGRQLHETKSYVHAVHDWMAASPDRVVDSSLLVEIKTHNRWMRDQYGEQATDAVPEYEFVQVQHQMAVTGAERVDVAVLFGESQALLVLADMVADGGVSLDFAATVARQMEFGIWTVLRDDEFIADLIAAEREFWTRYVLGDEWPEDYRRMKPRSAVRKATAEEEAVAELLRQAWVAMKRSEKAYNALRETVEDAIRDAEGIETAVGRITWKRTADTTRTSTDWEALAVPLLADMPQDEIDKLVAENTNTTTREGTRRFTVPSIWKADL